jgi:hypothetical protein
MKLSQLLSTLTSTNITVSIADLDSGAEIANMKASGYASLDDTIENREVKQWMILSASSIKIIVGDIISDTHVPDTTVGG